MKKMTKASTVLGLVVAATAIGCKSSESEPASTSASAKTAKTEPMPMHTTTAPESASTAASPPPAAAATVATPALADKDMTHVLSKDEAYFTSTPAPGKAPDGTLKAGTKVVVMMPRGGYSQVMTADGKRVYTTTAALKPVGS